MSSKKHLSQQARPGPRLITLVVAPLEGVVVSAETPSDGGHQLMTGLAVQQLCIHRPHIADLNQ